MTIKYFSSILCLSSMTVWYLSSKQTEFLLFSFKSCMSLTFDIDWQILLLVCLLE